MPRNTSVFQVFVASPSDVADERGVLEGVIAQLNQIWSKSLGITFELLKWETNVHPSFASDPQTVINNQIGLEYDVFIGIFWGRLGTPTPRAASGTLEEFERAYQRFVLTKTSPEIMIYFKDAGIPPSKTDIEQLKQVNEFRSTLSEMGGLYSMFEDQAGFESSLRSHLSALAQKFSAQHALPITQPFTVSSQQVQEIQLLPEEDDYGLIDYTEIYTSRLAEMTSAMSSISDAGGRLGEQLVQRTTELQNVNKSSTKDIRRHAKRAADDLNNFADIVKIQVGIMSFGREVAFDALSKALSLQPDFSTNKSDFQSLRIILIAVIESVYAAGKSTSELRSSISSIPRITKDLNVSKRAVVTQLDLVKSEFDNVVLTLNNILEAIDRMLDVNGDGALSL